MKTVELIASRYTVDFPYYSLDARFFAPLPLLLSYTVLQRMLAQIFE